MENSNDKNSIEDIKKRLYSRNLKNDINIKKGSLHDSLSGVNDDWGREDNGSKITEIMRKKGIKTPTFSKLLTFATLFFVASVVFAGYMFFAGSNMVSPDNINIKIAGPAFIEGGEELALKVTVENKNSTSLELADMIIEYPKGSVSPNGTTENSRMRKSLGSIAPGRKSEDIVRLMLFGEEGSDKNIKFTLEYRIAGSNAIFVKEEMYTVKISSAPINLKVEAPSDVGSNQELAMNIKLDSNSSQDVKDLLLQVDYPPGFDFASSEPKPTYGNNVWVVGDMKTGDSKQISIKGLVNAEDSEDRTFRIYTGSRSQSDEKSIQTVYNSIFQTIKIKKPSLETRVSLNNDLSTTISSQGEKAVRGEIVWKNNSPAKIDDGEISIKVTGNTLNKYSVVAEHGFYNSASDTIVWNKNTYGDFGSIEPGESGSLSFDFSSLPLVSENGTITTSPKIDLDITVKWRGFASDGSQGEFTSVSKKTVRILTDLQITPRALYYSGPFQNSGPLPPKAEKETTYTIVWTVTNSSNPISSGVVRATLPSYVNWIGKVSPDGESVTYNESTREIVWTAGEIKSGTGLSTRPKEVAFQVKLTPSLSQINKTPMLLSETAISGFDQFTKNDIKVVRPGLTTLLSTDSNFKYGNELVAR